VIKLHFLQNFNSTMIPYHRILDWFDNKQTT